MSRPITGISRTYSCRVLSRVGLVRLAVGLDVAAVSVGLLASDGDKETRVYAAVLGVLIYGGLFALASTRTRPAAIVSVGLSVVAVASNAITPDLAQLVVVALSVVGAAVAVAALRQCRE
jgi:glycosyltransferase A (GT-A) superfamily protein (DUF2064 family)